ncbi:MAG: leucyl/phenylalanyl-tRNA--protein transferase [Glaciecola sp.]|jgi:leucyl/phenylalanyl-tRNA--protein transferase
MTIYLPELDPNSLAFPAIEQALSQPNGLLAFGGDLSVARLCLAYDSGIFPWFSEADPYLWWSPDPRCVITYDRYHCNKTFRKWLRKHHYTVTINHAFATVLSICATIPRPNIQHADGSQSENGTWITPEMQHSYRALHAHGRAHSIEVWEGQQLVGGLYGVSAKGVFCGESMFHLQPNTSKLAFYTLIQYCKNMGIAFIDCQLQNPYLQSLGAFEIPREEYLSMLDASTLNTLATDIWQPCDLTYILTSQGI